MRRVRSSSHPRLVTALGRRLAPAAVVILLAAAASLPALPQEPGQPGAPQSPPVIEGIQVPPPPFTEGIFPCSGCHKDLKPDPTPRALTAMHDDVVLRHGERGRWCFDCHNPDDRDKLRLASGKLIPFTESYLLCGQCHGDKYRDWKVGVHGKRTGEWNGKKQYLLCVNCHNPHSPHFKPLKPLPPPVPPDQIQAVKGGRP